MKVAEIYHVFAKLHRIVCTKDSLCLQINGKQNTIFHISFKRVINKMHEATLKLVITQRQYAELLLPIIDG